MSYISKYAVKDFDSSDLVDNHLEIRDKVLTSDIPWNNLVPLGLITEKELQLIKKYDKRPLSTKKSLIEKEPQEYANLFINLIGGGPSPATRTERTHYALALIEELISDDESSINIFFKLEDPFTPFLRLLSKNEEFTSSSSTLILSMLLIKCTHPPLNIVLDLIAWCSERIRSTHPELSTALCTLRTLLRKDNFRRVFFNEDGLNRLGTLVRPSQVVTQTLYQTLNCLWLMSYTAQIASEFHTTTIIPKLIDILKYNPKNKISRVSIAIFRNLANKGRNNQLMIDFQLNRIVQSLTQRNLGDDELDEDLEFLSKILEEELAILSTFDIYRSEVRSGNLEWSHTHKSEKFWKENVHKFEENNFEIISLLLSIIKNSSSSYIALSVACHDIGEFIRTHPRGREIVNALDGKLPVMRLMEHNDPDVQKHALLCTQKMMVINWEYLSR